MVFALRQDTHGIESADSGTLAMESTFPLQPGDSKHEDNKIANFKVQIYMPQHID